MIAELRKTNFVLAWFVFVVAALLLLPGVSVAQQDAMAQKVQTAIQLLKAKADQLGQPKIEGKSAAAGEQVPAIYFGRTQMNNNFDLVDEVQKQTGAVATIFVKNGDQFVRVATNVKKDDGSRAVGTILDPKGKAIESIRKNEAYHGEADILGKAYVTAYEPIRDADKNVIGIYFVGYQKGQ
jgi:hypothetical protein